MYYYLPFQIVVGWDDGISDIGTTMAAKAAAAMNENRSTRRKKWDGLYKRRHNDNIVSTLRQQGLSSVGHSVTAWDGSENYIDKVNDKTRFVRSLY